MRRPCVLFCKHGIIYLFLEVRACKSHLFDIEKDKSGYKLWTLYPSVEEKMKSLLLFPDTLH